MLCQSSTRHSSIMMGVCRFIACAFAMSAMIAVASSRAVNISNTWMLPEEGFPVFYRYFRDRISWYEADAVCQFHHANLVTADTTSQYDAIRAYLKELDITENVWIGLSRPSNKPNFAWSNSKPLSGEGHWQQAIPIGTEPLCAAMDPAADFLWKPLYCGGPEIAAFICELPVPSWALGLRGCLLTELPSLTVLYLPEQAAIELTSDCGLDGTKRIACKGNADREEILKQLTCAISSEDFDEKPTKAPITSSTASELSTDENSLNKKTTRPWIWTSNTIDIDYGMPTRHRRETEDTLSPISTKSTTDLSTSVSFKQKSTVTARSVLEDKKLTPSEAVTVSNLNYVTEVTSFSSESDVTLNPSVSQRSDKSQDLTATQVADVTTQDANSRPEEQAEIAVKASATTETKAAAESEGEDAGEYPSAINQGQLFSIIENGTMFDIIELNETGTDDSKKAKQATSSNTNNSNIAHSSSVPSVTTAQPTTTKINEPLYTTVIYNKEPTVDVSFVTNKSLKRTDKIAKKQLLKESDPKKSNYPSDKEKSMNKEKNTTENKEKSINRNNTTYDLTKEIDMFAIVSNSSEVKLNRTFRKQLPTYDSRQEAENDDMYNLDHGSSYGIPRVLNMSSDNFIINPDQHQHVEIKLDMGNKTQNAFIITTKRVDKTKMTTQKPIASTEPIQYQNIELASEEQKEALQPVIDPKLDELNHNIKAQNNESEDFIPMKEKKIDLAPKESSLDKQFPPKSSTEEDTSLDKHNETEDFPKYRLTEDEVTDNHGETEVETFSQEPFEPIPEQQPRPNRQRQLTRPQRKSFYPYFFSRVLG